MKRAALCASSSMAAMIVTTMNGSTVTVGRRRTVKSHELATRSSAHRHDLATLKEVNVRRTDAGIIQMDAGAIIMCRRKSCRLVVPRRASVRLMSSRAGLSSNGSSAGKASAPNALELESPPPCWNDDDHSVYSSKLLVRHSRVQLCTGRSMKRHLCRGR